MENGSSSVEEEKNKQGISKSQIVLRCAKAALLLSTLRNHCPNSTQSIPTADADADAVAVVDKDGDQIWELKKELVKEKLKNKKMRFCSLTELVLQIVMLLSLWTICLFIAFNIL